MFFNFSIRFQRYKERKILGGGSKVMNISSTKGHGRCPVLKICTWTIFYVCLHIFPIWILKCFLNEKCAFSCLFSCAKILESVIDYFWNYALKSGHRSISKVTSFWNFILYVEMAFRIVFFVFCVMLGTRRYVRLFCFQHWGQCGVLVWGCGLSMAIFAWLIFGCAYFCEIFFKFLHDYVCLESCSVRSPVLSQILEH